MHAPDSEIEVTIIVSIFILLFGGAWIILFLFFYQKKQHANKRKILETELETKEQTLKLVSEIIHDDIGQKLSVAILKLSSLGDTRVDRILNLVDECMNGLRNLSKMLDPDISNSLLTELIRFEIEHLKETEKFELDFSIVGTEKKIGNTKQLPIFRIFQECINNTVKHSKAKKVSVNLVFQSDKLILDIKDDGVGFDASAIREKEFKERGVGLRNLKTNAHRIDGELIIKSEPQQGTHVTLTTLI